MTSFYKTALAAASLTFLASGAMAAPVYDTSTSIELSGTRSTGGGGLIIGGGNVTSASLAWVITDNGDGTLHYKYTFSENSQQGISHFVLDLSDNCGAASGCLTNVAVNGDYELAFGTFDSSNGNPGFTGLIVGVKFDDLDAPNPFVFEFDSNRAAVWGDFYAKGGNGTSNGFAVFNDGADEHGSDDISKFIARPDTINITQVPVPGVLGLLGMSLVGLGMAARRRRSN